MDALWGLLSVAALNAQPDRSSLALAVKVFRTGVLDGTDSADIGIPRRPLGALHDTAAHRALHAAGVRVLLRTKAVGLRRDALGWRVPVRGRGGEDVLNADSVVVAVPHQHATALLTGLPLPAVPRWSGLSAAPIVNVHVHYDRAVLAEPMPRRSTHRCSGCSTGPRSQAPGTASTWRSRCPRRRNCSTGAPTSCASCSCPR